MKMRKETLEIVRAVLLADHEVPPEERARFIAFLRSPTVPVPPPSDATAPRLIKRAEAANRLGYSTRMMDKLAASGVLRKCKLPGRVRAAGFLESDIPALIENKNEN